MKYLTALSALALCACGGGGGSGGGSFPSAAVQQTAPVAQEAPAVTNPVFQIPVNPGCTMSGDRPYCELIANDSAIGIGVAANNVAVFTNHTGSDLQIERADAYTGEQTQWGEYCAYLLNDLSQAATAQSSAGIGEVGCATKNIGETYPSLKWGSGLLVKPGQMLMLNSHVEPANTAHTYSLRVHAATGVSSWRMPKTDAVINCDGQPQPTAGDRWTNTTGKDLQVTGASIYSVSGNNASPNTMNGPACIYVFTAEGAVKYQNCDNQIRTRGDISFPAVSIAPGESVAAQALNVCSAPSLWGWAAFLRITGE